MTKLGGPREVPRPVGKIGTSQQEPTWLICAALIVWAGIVVFAVLAFAGVIS